MMYTKSQYRKEKEEKRQIAQMQFIALLLFVFLLL